MSGADRRMLFGVAIATACSVGVFGAYNFVVDPISSDLDATRNQALLLREIPSIGTLAVVFLVGAWGTRWGMKRVIVGSAVVTALGYLIVLVSSSMPLVTVGMLLGSVGKQGIGVVTISLVATRLMNESERASGFAAVGMASPVGYLVIPVVANALLDATNWRVVVALWIALSAAGAAAAFLLLPPDGERSEQGEMWTPALAGLVLVGLVQSVRLVSEAGVTAPRTLVWLAVMLLALVILWRLMTRLAHPTLDLSLLKNGGARLLLIVVVLLPFANLYYYFAVGVQSLYGYSAAETALLMVPCQLAAIAGAWVAGRGMKRLGLRTTGTVMLLALSASLFLTTAQTVTTPVVYPLVVLCLFALACTGGGVVLTNAVMNLSPAGKEGSASSIRSAAGSVGVALGVAMSAAVFFGTTQGTLTQLVADSGGDITTAEEIVSAVRDSTVTAEQIASTYSLPVDVVTSYESELLESRVAGYRAQGLLGGCIGLIATLVFFFNRRGLRPVEEVGVSPSKRSA